jgi:hypothetical protein
MDLEQHNSELIHRTLLKAIARLTPDKFQEFRDALILNSRKRNEDVLSGNIIFF